MRFAPHGWHVQATATGTTRRRRRRALARRPPRPMTAPTPDRLPHDDRLRRADQGRDQRAHMAPPLGAKARSPGRGKRSTGTYAAVRGHP